MTLSSMQNLFFAHDLMENILSTTQRKEKCTLIFVQHFYCSSVSLIKDNEKIQYQLVHKKHLQLLHLIQLINGS